MSAKNTKDNNTPTILIIGAGLGGLLLYHGIQKHLNKDEKKFNVKIFERDTHPEDKWQGYYVGLNPNGIRSLISCLPESLVARLPDVIPTPINEKEYMGTSYQDYKGAELFKSPLIPIRPLSELAKLKTKISVAMGYRDRLRDLMMEGVDMQWGKKCIGYDESDDEVWAIFQDGTRVRGDILIGCDGIHSQVRKQRLPHLQVLDYGITQVIMEPISDKKLMDRFIALNGNSIIQSTYGQGGDHTIMLTRSIPIETDITEETPDDQIHYRSGFIYTYYSHLDKNVDVDDNNPQSVLDHTRTMIKQHREPCEFTDILLDFTSFVPTSPPKEHERTTPFRNYNPTKRRPMQDIDPMSIEPWESTRVTLLGDAVHAMSFFSGYGTNSALQDAESLVKSLSNYEENGYKLCIQEYENEMRMRTSKCVLESRKACLASHVPRGKYKNLFRDTYLSGKL